MIVLDAGAALAGLLRPGAARSVMQVEALHAPELIDYEIANGLRRLVLHKQLDEQVAARVLGRWRQLAIRRAAVLPSLDRVWQLRHNLTAYDASYVALAEGYACALVTADSRIALVPGLRCSVTVVPR